MPRGKRTMRRRGGRKRQGGRMQIYGSAYSQLKRDIGWLMSVVNVENKYIDTLFNGNNMTNGLGSQSLLNGTTTGTTSVTRNGQSTKAIKVIIDLIASVGATTPVYCRLILIRDSAANAATISVGNIFQAAVDGANNYTTSQRKVDTVGSRVHFYLDEQFQLDSVQNTSRRVKTVIKLGFHTRYNTGNAGTVADISENSLYWCAMSSAGATPPTFTGSIRFLFTDN